MSNQVLLDTHTWIWVVNGDERARQSPSLKLIEDSAKTSHLFISSISLWEIAMLESKGRLRFPRSCLEWMNEALATPGLNVMEILPEIAVESSRLPGSFHGDSADRMIVATSRTQGLTLITQDQKILEYGQAGFLRSQALF